MGSKVGGGGQGCQDIEENNMTQAVFPNQQIDFVKSCLPTLLIELKNVSHFPKQILSGHRARYIESQKHQTRFVRSRQVSSAASGMPPKKGKGGAASKQKSKDEQHEDALQAVVCRCDFIFI